jgi:hypothetical protein
VAKCFEPTLFQLSHPFVKLNARGHQVVRLQQFAIYEAHIRAEHEILQYREYLKDVTQ